MESSLKTKTKTTKEGDTNEREVMSESDVSESAMESGSGRNRLWRKVRQNPRFHASALSSGDDTAASARSVRPAPGKIRSRRKEFLAHSESGSEVQAAGKDTRQLALNILSAGDEDSRSAVALKEQVLKDIGVVLNVSAKSKHLKGTYQRALNEAANSIQVAVEALHTRSSTTETRKLQADNSRLQKEVAELRGEMLELREEMARLKSSQSQTEKVPEALEPRVTATEELTQAIIQQVESVLNARLEAIEKRIPLTPPVADRSYSKVVAAPGLQKGPEVSDGMVATGGKNEGKKKRGPRGSKTKVADQGPPSLEPVSRENEWITVTKRGKKRAPSGKKAEKEVPQGRFGKPKPNTTAAVKLRPPRSSAVVITLKPEAEKRGVTFANVLTKARDGIDLPSLSITGLKFRTAATGARILEVPGASSGDKADTLAHKIRETLGEEVAIVSRPVKCAELRITGLDDSVTPDDVAVAVARDGGCQTEGVKVGVIRPTPRGVSSVWVRAPVAAVKKIGKLGRLLIGWVSARAEVLQPRTLRCYRCLQSGHVRAQCTAEADRSEECYRCGKPGHKANACTDTAKCSVCAAANRPADHRLGSKACSPPKMKKRGPRAATALAPVATSALVAECPPTERGTEVVVLTEPK